MSSLKSSDSTPSPSSTPASLKSSTAASLKSSTETPSSTSLKSSTETPSSASLKSSTETPSTASLKSSDSSSSSSSSLKSSSDSGSASASLKSSSSLKSSTDASLKSSLKSSSLKSTSSASSSLKSSASSSSSSSSTTTTAPAHSFSTFAPSTSASEALSSSGLAANYDVTSIHFDFQLFHKHLNTKILGRTLTYLPVTTSTMDMCKSHVSCGGVMGSLFLSECQTSGRGRGEGRVWSSTPTGNLYATILLTPNTHAQLTTLNFALPIAVCKAIQAHGIPDPKIKWPNDVWIDGLKVCGMLLDVSSLGSVLSVAGGIGINVNQDMTKDTTDEAIQRTATSLSSVLGSPVCRESVLASVLNSLEELLSSYSTIESILPEYTKYDMCSGNRVVVMPKKREDTASYYDATCLGYSHQGFMKIRKDDNTEHLLVSEEVSIRPAQRH